MSNCIFIKNIGTEVSKIIINELEINGIRIIELIKTEDIEILLKVNKTIFSNHQSYELQDKICNGESLTNKQMFNKLKDCLVYYGFKGISRTKLVNSEYLSFFKINDMTINKRINVFSIDGFHEYFKKDIIQIIIWLQKIQLQHKIQDENMFNYVNMLSVHLEKIDEIFLNSTLLENFLHYVRKNYVVDNIKENNLILENINKLIIRMLNLLEIKKTNYLVYCVFNEILISDYNDILDNYILLNNKKAEESYIIPPNANTKSISNMYEISEKVDDLSIIKY
jgi:hypothetical protein